MSKILTICATVYFFLTIACNTSKKDPKVVTEGRNYLESIKIGMTKNELVNNIGKPDSIVDLGRVTDEYNYTQHIEIYFYGSNQSATFINDTVNALDYNIKQTEARIKYRMDSAKAAQ